VRVGDRVVVDEAAGGPFGSLVGRDPDVAWEVWRTRPGAVEVVAPSWAELVGRPRAIWDTPGWLVPLRHVHPEEDAPL
jgi:hypothetical protein